MDRAISRTFSTATPGAARRSVTSGSPRVSVPVLSKTTVVSRWAFSRLSPPRMRMPLSAPSPVPTMTAVGVANPRAQGQAITSTEMKFSSARLKPDSGTREYQTTKVRMPMKKTAGTKTEATRSASRWIGAFDPCASSTRRMILASAVSAPIFVARKTKLPDWFIVAAKTSLPACFSTGMLSPVSMDSSTDDAPETTTPSVGIFSPGRTRIMSSFITASMAMSASRPSRITRAVLGLSPTSRRMAELVRPFAPASRSRPRMISVTIMAAPS